MADHGLGEKTAVEWMAVVVMKYEVAKGDFIAVGDGTGKIIALCGKAGADDEAESIENAKLIVASPKMLELVEYIYKNPDSAWSDVYTMVLDIKSQLKKG